MPKDNTLSFYSVYIGIASIPIITYFVSKEHKLRNSLLVLGGMVGLGALALSQMKVS
jgi:hypothetical protein